LQINKVYKYSILLISIIFWGCDPAFEHEFKGKIVDGETSIPLIDTNLKYKLYPVVENTNWRLNNIDLEAVKFTDEKGMFSITANTISVSFDSLVLVIEKEGYLEKRIVSKHKDWKSKTRFNLRTFQLDFDNINLERID